MSTADSAQHPKRKRSSTLLRDNVELGNNLETPVAVNGEAPGAQPTKRTKRVSAGSSSSADVSPSTGDLGIDLARLTPAGYKLNPPPTDRPVRVYADGVFDLFHLGHMRQLEQAKKSFPSVYLLVGIPSDKETHKYKGLTVLSDKERAESLRHCKWVDEVIEDAPWIVTPEFLELHQIDYVAHDDEPYVSAEYDDIYKPCKQAGKFVVTQRTEGISTTYIITKIVRDYEKYISRQLQRGASRQELNLSWLKKNELDLKRHVQELRETIKNNWSTTGRELRDEFRNYWAPSPRPSSPYTFGQNNQSNATLAPGTAQQGEGAGQGRDGETVSRPLSPHTEFANGYSLGLIGGVRSWLRDRASRNGSMAASDESDEEESAQSPDEKKDGQRRPSMDQKRSSSEGLFRLPSIRRSSAGDVGAK